MISYSRDSDVNAVSQFFSKYPVFLSNTVENTMNMLWKRLIFAMPNPFLLMYFILLGDGLLHIILEDIVLETQQTHNTLFLQ